MCSYVSYIRTSTNKLRILHCLAQSLINVLPDICGSTIAIQSLQCERDKGHPCNHHPCRCRMYRQNGVVTPSISPSHAHSGPQAGRPAGRHSFKQLFHSFTQLVTLLTCFVRREVVNERFAIPLLAGGFLAIHPLLVRRRNHLAAAAPLFALKCVGGSVHVTLQLHYALMGNVKQRFDGCVPGLEPGLHLANLCGTTLEQSQQSFLKAQPGL